MQWRTAKSVTCDNVIKAKQIGTKNLISFPFIAKYRR